MDDPTGELLLRVLPKTPPRLKSRPKPQKEPSSSIPPPKTPQLAQRLPRDPPTGPQKQGLGAQEQKGGGGAPIGPGPCSFRFILGLFWVRFRAAGAKDTNGGGDTEA